MRREAETEPKEKSKETMMHKGRKRTSRLFNEDEKRWRRSRDESLRKATAFLAQALNQGVEKRHVQDCKMASVC
jgi:hypothetical protein